MILCFLMFSLPSSSSLFPYTTLFRSLVEFGGKRGEAREQHEEGERRPLPGMDGDHRDERELRVAEPVVAPQAEGARRSEEHTSELQSRLHLVCRLLLEKKKSRCVHGE